MYGLLRPLLFTLPPETAHALSLAAVDWLGRAAGKNLLRGAPAQTPVNVLGLPFDSPVGLAAGLDKDGRHIDGLAGLGFGFLEIGTVTPLPQPGNPRPRMFRLPEAQAIINRMGFNNDGVEALCDAVSKANYRGVLGINIGKNKNTPADHALDDYLLGLRAVYPLASYVTVNLSSPNTPGLRDLQFGEPLRELLSGLVDERRRLADAQGRHVPLLLKIAPDLADDDLQGIIDEVLRQGIEGVIATNTTISRRGVEGLRHADEPGGLSGGPLTDTACSVLARIRNQAGRELVLIAAGGIMAAEDARRRMSAGADLLQLYTGFIYRGPALIREVEAECRPFIAAASGR